MTVRLEEPVRLRDGFVRREGTRFRLDSGRGVLPDRLQLGLARAGGTASAEHLQRMARWP